MDTTTDPMAGLSEGDRAKVETAAKALNLIDCLEVDVADDWAACDTRERDAYRTRAAAALRAVGAIAPLPPPPSREERIAAEMFTVYESENHLWLHCCPANGGGGQIFGEGSGRYIDMVREEVAAALKSHGDARFREGAEKMREAARQCCEDWEEMDGGAFRRKYPMLHENLRELISSLPLLPP